MVDPTVNEDPNKLIEHGHCRIREWVDQEQLQLLMKESSGVAYKCWRNIFNATRPNPGGSRAIILLPAVAKANVKSKVECHANPNSVLGSEFVYV